MNVITAIAREAGDKIMEFYREEGAVAYKQDGSPVTHADKAAHEIIVQRLSRLSPAWPVLSEEGEIPAYRVRQSWESFWMVDPLDGTREFIEGNGDFTVNIALIRNGTPILGVVYAPVSGLMYAAADGIGAYRNGQALPSRIRVRESRPLRVAVSRSHQNDETLRFIATLSEEGMPVELLTRGSSLKICMVAEGNADIYPRMGPTMEWDTAAADAIVRACGGRILAYPGDAPLVYNKEDLLNPWFVVS